MNTAAIIQAIVLLLPNIVEVAKWIHEGANENKKPKILTELPEGGPRSAQALKDALAAQVLA